MAKTDLHTLVPGVRDLGKNGREKVALLLSPGDRLAAHANPRRENACIL
jgi:hypothetical protein